MDHRVFPKKQTVLQLDIKPPPLHFLVPGYPLPGLQQLATCPYPESDESCPRRPHSPCFFKIHFNIILHLDLTHPSGPFLQVPHQNKTLSSNFVTLRPPHSPLRNKTYHIWHNNDPSCSLHNFLQSSVNSSHTTINTDLELYWFRC